MRYLFLAVIMILGPTLGFAQDQQASPGQAFLRALDADGNGTVSHDEFIKPQLQQIEKQFEYMDKDKNGQVDVAEADIFATEMQKHLQQMRHQQQR